MGKTYTKIEPELARFIAKQKMFFVATAPLAAEGHVNVSPKGLDSLRLLDDQTVAYADLVGSGIETIAHVRENQRMVIMFCAFEGAPRIVRLHGRGEVLWPDEPQFEQVASQFPPLSGLRAIVRLHCERISDSCGYGVPLYEFRGERSQLVDWAEKKGVVELAKYQQTKNAQSIDGLPGILK